MNKIIKEHEFTQEDIERMVESVVLDEYFYCPHCEYGDLEPDYDTCPECHRKNPLKILGLI